MTSCLPWSITSGCTYSTHKWGSNERLFQAVGEFEVEMVADCGSMLLGSTVTPYVTQHRQETGDRGCSEYELGVARALIDKAEPRPNG